VGLLYEILIRTALLQNYSIKYDPKHHRLRCQGHILNLCVNSFLFVTNDETLEQDDDEDQAASATLEEIKQWRKYGPLGKLHNIVVHIQATPQRMHNLKLLSYDRRPARDNKTRWNSWERMLRIAIKNPVHSAIKAYFQHFLNDEIALDELTLEDWQILRNIHDFLDDLAQTTKALESDSSTLDKVLPSMDYVLERFEATKEQYKDDAIMAPMLNSGWAKLDKYYHLTDESPAYVAALVLRPGYKWAYVNAQWQPGWVTEAKAAMQKLWEDFYKPQGIPSQPPPSPNSTKQNRFEAWSRKHTITTDFDDEYARYCASDVIPVSDSKGWWMEETQQKVYPNLSRMALDFLSIPAMSAAPERLFSGAKETLRDKRNRLGMDLIQAFESLKSWYKLKEWDCPSLKEERDQGQLAELAERERVDDAEFQG